MNNAMYHTLQLISRLLTDFLSSTSTWSLSTMSLTLPLMDFSISFTFSGTICGNNTHAKLFNV